MLLLGRFLCGVGCRYWGFCIGSKRSKADVNEAIPLMQILSPRWASERMSLAPSIVRDVPPPPAVLVSRGSSEDTAVRTLYQVSVWYLIQSDS